MRRTDHGGQGKAGQGKAGNPEKRKTDIKRKAETKKTQIRMPIIYCGNLKPDKKRDARHEKND
jgi:hypothetical protein